MMRLDPDLCFLNKCGPPDSADIQEELKKSQIVDPDENSKMDDDEERYAFASVWVVFTFSVLHCSFSLKPGL